MNPYKVQAWDFPGGPGKGPGSSTTGGVSPVPDWGTNMPHGAAK